MEKNVSRTKISSSGGISFSVRKPLVRNGKVPTARGGSSLIYADGKLVLFGGHYFAGDGIFKYLDETWLFDIEKVVWYCMPCSGEIPGARYGHSAQIIGSRMFIFGGKGAHGIMFKDVCFLDLMEWIWVPVNTLSQGPSARMNHASELVGRKIVVHGGWDGNDTFDDFWIFNTDSFSWMQPRTAGFAPTARFGHTITLIPDGRLLVFGGCSVLKETGFPKYHDDIRQLDTDTMIWTRPRMNGISPSGRYGHTMIALGDQKLALFGGWGRGGCQTYEMINNPQAHTVHVLDATTMTWYNPQRNGNKPLRHLYNHAAACTDSGMFIFGGFDGQQAVADLGIVEFEAVDPL